MGSSYRQDLKLGGMKEWEDQLREVCRHIQIVMDDVREAVCNESQYDNAADTGGLIEKLGLAKRLIEEELPTPSADSTEGQS